VDRTAFPAELIDIRRADGHADLVLPGRPQSFRLNAVSEVIAEALRRPTPISLIEHALLRQFDVEPERCHAALDGFLSELCAERAIAVFADAAAPARRRYLDLLQRALVNLIYPEHELRIEGLEAHGRTGDRLAYERRLRDIRYLEPATFDSLRAHKGEGLDWRKRPSRFAHTMVGLRRLDNLEYCAAHVYADGVPGDFLEAGVLQGGAAIYLRALQVIYGQDDRATWVADSFTGPPDASLDLDRRWAAEFTEACDPWLAASRTAVEDNFRTYDLLSDRVHFLEGDFAETLPAAPVERLAILRFDAGLYAAATAVLEHLYGKVSPGGFVVIDDYSTFEPCRRAVDDFRASRGVTAPLRRPDWNSVYWQKA
jgi:O-methyltransferase